MTVGTTMQIAPTLVYVCFVRIPEKRGDMNIRVFITEPDMVYCALRAALYT